MRVVLELRRLGMLNGSQLRRIDMRAEVDFSQSQIFEPQIRRQMSMITCQRLSVLCRSFSVC
jgi:hypothetical protein